MTDQTLKPKEIDSRIIRIKLVDNTLLTGQVNLKRGEKDEYGRLSDLLTQNEDKFLVVFSATEYREDLEQNIKHKTIFINKDHILWAMPEDTQI